MKIYSTLIRSNETNRARSTALAVRPSNRRLSVMAGLCVLTVLACVGPAASSGRADVLVTDYSPGKKVARYDEQTGAYLGDFVPAGSGGLQGPYDLRFGPDNNLYVGDAIGNQILRYNGQTGAFQDVFASAGLTQPAGMIFGPEGNLYVCNYSPRGVAVIDGHTGTVLRYLTNSNMANPAGLKFGPDGMLYVADSGAGVLRFNASTGNFIDVFAAQTNFASPPKGGAVDLCFGTDGNLYVTDAGNSRVLRFNGISGTNMGVFASGGGLCAPNGVAFAPNGDLCVVKVNYQAFPDLCGSGSPGVLRFDGMTGAFKGQTVTSGVVIPERLVFTPPLLLTIRVSEVEVAWNSASNATYRVDYRSSLTTNNWTPLVNCIRAVGPATSVADKVAPGEPQRFYRVAATNCVP